MKTPVVSKPPVIEPVVQEQEDPYLKIFRMNKANYTPANWTFTPKEGEPDIIEGRNCVTGLLFEGPISDFNYILRLG